jgi:hypothetical protein
MWFTKAGSSSYFGPRLPNLESMLLRMISITDLYIYAPDMRVCRFWATFCTLLASLRAVLVLLSRLWASRSKSVYIISTNTYIKIPNLQGRRINFWRHVHGRNLFPIHSHTHTYTFVYICMQMENRLTYIPGFRYLFGGACITSVGMMGLDTVYIPFTPWARLPLCKQCECVSAYI